MTTPTEREKLRLQIVDLMYKDGADAIADFILADRARIVEPLVKYKNFIRRSWKAGVHIYSDEAIDETLKNAGVQ